MRQLVRVSRRDPGFLTRTADRVAVTLRRVVIARGPLRLGLPGSGPLRRVDGCIAQTLAFGPPFRGGGAGVKEVVVPVRPEPGAHDRLALRPELNLPDPVPARGFMSRGRVDPDCARRAQVAFPHCRDLTGAHPGVPLLLHHRPDRPGHVGPDRLDVRVGRRPDQRRLPGDRPPFLKPGDGFQSEVYRRRNAFILDGRLEHVDDPPDSLVIVVRASPDSTID